MRAQLRLLWTYPLIPSYNSRPVVGDSFIIGVGNPCSFNSHQSKPSWPMFRNDKSLFTEQTRGGVQRSASSPFLPCRRCFAPGLRFPTQLLDCTPALVCSVNKLQSVQESHVLHMCLTFFLKKKHHSRSLFIANIAIIRTIRYTASHLQKLMGVYGTDSWSLFDNRNVIMIRAVVSIRLLWHNAFW